MASNPYVNKVQLADGTSIMDISDTTAVASDVLNSKYFYTASGQKVQGIATDDDFIVTFTKNQNNQWIPDKTYTELVNAYSNGKTITGYAEVTDEYDYTYSIPVCIYGDSDSDNIYFNYYVADSFTSLDGSYGGVLLAEGYIDENGWNGEYYWEDKYFLTYNSNAVASDIKSGKRAYNSEGMVIGTYTPNLQSKYVTPSATAQTITADNGYEGLNSVQVAGDNSLIAGNIKKNVSIFGVTGTYDTNEFVVEITYDNESGDWIPNKTFSEISAAYLAGKEISTCMDSYFVAQDTTADGWFNNLSGYYYYIVHELENGISGGNILLHSYILTSNEEIELMNESIYIIPNLQTKTKIYTPTENQQTETITADTDDGYNGLQQVNVTVNAISSTYIGSGITRRSSSDLSASGATVTVPSGYYENQVTKNIANGSATTPATSITANPSISINSNGLITASVSGSQNVTPTVNAGYVSSGTAGTVTVGGSATQQLTTQGATTITPTTSAQIISANTYLTGQLTVSGDVNLISSNIIEGKSIFNVAGNAKLPVVSQDSVTKVLSIS